MRANEDEMWNVSHQLIQVSAVIFWAKQQTEETSETNQLSPKR